MVRSKVQGSILDRAGKDYRCWRDFRTALSRAGENTLQSELGVTGKYAEQFEEAKCRMDDALIGVKPGLSWWLGKVKARIGVEPPEPEEIDILPNQ